MPIIAEAIRFLSYSSCTTCAFVFSVTMKIKATHTTIVLFFLLLNVFFVFSAPMKPFDHKGKGLATSSSTTCDRLYSLSGEICKLQTQERELSKKINTFRRLTGSTSSPAASAAYKWLGKLVIKKQGQPKWQAELGQVRSRLRELRALEKQQTQQDDVEQA